MTPSLVDADFSSTGGKFAHLESGNGSNLISLLYLDAEADSAQGQFHASLRAGNGSIFRANIELQGDDGVVFLSTIDASDTEASNLLLSEFSANLVTSSGSGFIF